MSEKIAVVGNRFGADLRQVEEFCLALYARQPDSIIISGGASGVDSKAESTWFSLGGRVRSYRPALWPGTDLYGVEVWNYGAADEPYVLPVQEQRVQLADLKSATLYSRMLITEDCDRLVAFYRQGMTMSSGTAFTESWARDREVPAYSFIAKAV